LRKEGGIKKKKKGESGYLRDTKNKGTKEIHQISINGRKTKKKEKEMSVRKVNLSP